MKNLMLVLLLSLAAGDAFAQDSRGQIVGRVIQFALKLAF